jgi:predicted transcriptional regulator
MTTVRTISFRIAADKVEELDALARSMDRDRSYLLNEALDDFLSQQQRFHQLVEQGLAALDRGETISDEELTERIDSWEQAASKQRIAERA